MKFEFDAFGSRLKVQFYDIDYSKEIEQETKQSVYHFEKKYSRFIEGNYLYKLNETKQAPATPELVSLLKLAKKVSLLTEGHYDITVLPVLENKGYGIHSEILHESSGSHNIEFNDNKILLHDGVSIDLGSMGKGYMIDVLYKYYESHSNNFIIDFGGDIRVKGKHKIHLESAENVGEIVGEINLEDASIAASSTSKRQFGDSHHLINMKYPDKDTEIESIYLTHRLAVFADIFSTAIFVSPMNIGEKILRTTPGLSGYVKSRSGKIITSKDFNPLWYKIG